MTFVGRLGLCGVREARSVVGTQDALDNPEILVTFGSSPSASNPEHDATRWAVVFEQR